MGLKMPFRRILTNMSFLMVLIVVAIVDGIVGIDNFSINILTG